MKVYAVGGSVRDELMGLAPNDYDYVVTGATEEEMIDAGYKKVGSDFPVFLDPVGEEYALARRERSTGDGYHDFAVEFDPGVTIEEDLLRRDFTMNAIAKDLNTGELIDPLDGVKHINERQLLATSNMTFIEDPVRVLRLARFASQFPFMEIDEKTYFDASLADISHATPERVLREMQKALMGIKPSNFFNTLWAVDQLHIWFQEIRDLRDIPQPVKHHAEGDAYVHTMMVLDAAARQDENFDVRYACLTHDLGKAKTPKDILPSHHGHEERGVALVEAMSTRLKVPTKTMKRAMYTARYHTHIHRLYELNPKTLVKLYDEIKSDLVKVTETLATTSFFDNEGKLPYRSYGDKHSMFIDIMLELLRNDKMSLVMPVEELKLLKISKIKEVRLKHLKKVVSKVRNMAGEG